MLSHFVQSKGEKKLTTAFGSGHSFHLEISGAQEGIPMGIPFVAPLVNLFGTALKGSFLLSQFPELA